MNVSVGKEFEEFVKGKVASGDNASVGEVVRDGLRLLKERELMLEAKLQALHGEIQRGVDQALAGELLDGSAVMEELRQELLKRKPQYARVLAGSPGANRSTRDPELHSRGQRRSGRQSS